MADSGFTPSRGDALRVLLVEDEKLITATLADALRDAGYEVDVRQDGAEALEALKERPYEVVITDVRLPRMDGTQLFEHIRRLQPEAFVIFMTAYASIEDAVRLLKNGAHDYIQKPFMNEDLVRRVKRIEQVLGLQRENQHLRRQLERRGRLGNLVGRSQAMRRVFELVDSVADSDCTVLIQGESGTGKALVAEALHQKSRRRKRPFFAISCSAIPESLIESELFGHVKGAFTDARADRIGRFEAADGGTVFLDDIDDLAMSVQGKLLRVLQERRIERLGEARSRHIDIRVIAATKRDLWPLVQEKTFREDLFFRLNVVKIAIPPLRERIQDIPVLLEHFLEKYGRGESYVVTPEVLEAMQAYSWPGNVRELEHAVERAILLAGEDRRLKREHLIAPESTEEGSVLTLKDLVARTEKEAIHRALKIVEGHRGNAARVLGISRKELWAKMKKYGIR